MIQIDNVAQNVVDIHACIGDALAKLGVCVRSVGQYGRNHPLIGELAEKAYTALAEALILQPAIFVAAADSYLALDTFPIEDHSGCLAGFARMLREHQISEMKFSAGLTVAEVVDFAEVLSFPSQDLEAVGGPIQELTKRNIVHIQVRVGLLTTDSCERIGADGIYEQVASAAEESARALQSGIEPPAPAIRAVVASALHSLIEDDTALPALATVRSRSRYLGEHSANVCILSMALGRDLGFDSATVLELGISALLHDVGKAFIPAQIAQKPGKLTEQEWEQVRRHPVEGAKALAGLPDLPALAAAIALEHHVRPDGSGYPALPNNRTPHLLSRLVAVVDSYDALTTDRPYRARWTPQQAIAWMLYESPDHYDRRLLARFAARAGLYPLGTIARLCGGEVAVVVGGSSEHPTRPKIRLLSGDSSVVDLAANTDPSLEIKSTAQPVEVLMPLGEVLAAR